MIINTDLLKTRKEGTYVAIYGTQENPFSGNYDLLYRDEAENMADALRKIAADIADEAARLTAIAASMEHDETVASEEYLNDGPR
jgi:hypothetical protein